MAPHGVRAMTRARAGPGDVAILLSAAAYGVSTTVSVAALDAVRPADLLAVELGGAATALLAAAALTGRLRRRGMLRHLLLGALVPGLAFLLADLGLARTSASSASLLLALDPLFAVLLAVIALGERLRSQAAVALVIGLAGSILVTLGPGGGRQGGSTTLGNLLANLTPVVGTLTAVAFLHERPTPLHLAGGAAILIGLALLLRGAPAPTPDGTDRPTADLLAVSTAGPSNDRKGDT